MVVVDTADYILAIRKAKNGLFFLCLFMSNYVEKFFLKNRLDININVIFCLDYCQQFGKLYLQEVMQRFI